MAYQMSITLTDAEYTALAKEAAKSGKPIEFLLHEALAQHIKPFAGVTHPITSRKIQEYLYHEGVIEHLPTNDPKTPEEDSERERLARLFGQGKPASEMVIEDRGPH